MMEHLQNEEVGAIIQVKNFQIWEDEVAYLLNSIVGTIKIVQGARYKSN
jgi:hypothetical protein